MSRRYRRDSLHSDGFRVPLDRNQRARFGYLAKMHARARRLTAKSAWVAQALLRRLGDDGECTPAHETLATDAGVHVSTVKRALERLKALGLVWWCRRIIRDGRRVEQTSNSYFLSSTGEIPVVISDAQIARGRDLKKKEVRGGHRTEAVSTHEASQAAAALDAARRKIEARVQAAWLARKGKAA